VSNRSIVGTVLVLLATGTLAASQAPQNPPQQPSPRAPSATTQQPTTTLAGCLYRENQIPGRKPNVAEQAGVLEDYILADASIPGPTAKPDSKPEGLTGNVPKQGNMFKVENIPDERLKALVGKRVEVTGKIDPEGSPGSNRPGGPTPDKGLGPDQINLPEFEAASIKEMPGTCPATPAPRRP
jgi:hypothetical protein